MDLDATFKDLGEIEFDIKSWGEVRWRKDLTSGAAPNMTAALQQIKTPRKKTNENT